MVRLTDRPDMTLDVYRGRKTTIQQNIAEDVYSRYLLKTYDLLLFLGKYRINVNNGINASFEKQCQMIALFNTHFSRSMKYNSSASWTAPFFYWHFLNENHKQRTLNTVNTVAYHDSCRSNLHHCPDLFFVPVSDHTI